MRYTSNHQVSLKKRNSILPFMFFERSNPQFYMALLFIAVVMTLSILGVVNDPANFLASI